MLVALSTCSHSIFDIDNTGAAVGIRSSTILVHGSGQREKQCNFCSMACDRTEFFLTPHAVIKVRSNSRHQRASPVSAFYDIFLLVSSAMSLLLRYSRLCAICSCSEATCFRSPSVFIMADHLYYKFHLHVRHWGVGASYCSLPSTIIMSSNRFVQLHPCNKLSCIWATFIVCNAPSSWRFNRYHHRPCIVRSCIRETFVVCHGSPSWRFTATKQFIDISVINGTSAVQFFVIADFPLLPLLCSQCTISCRLVCE